MLLHAYLAEINLAMRRRSFDRDRVAQAVTGIETMRPDGNPDVLYCRANAHSALRQTDEAQHLYHRQFGFCRMSSSIQRAKSADMRGFLDNFFSGLPPAITDKKAGCGGSLPRTGLCASSRNNREFLAFSEFFAGLLRLRSSQFRLFPGQVPVRDISEFLKLKQRSVAPQQRAIRRHVSSTLRFASQA